MSTVGPLPTLANPSKAEGKRPMNVFKKEAAKRAHYEKTTVRLSPSQQRRCN